MLGLLINEMEQKEIEYLLKREMDELLFDLGDSRIDQKVKEAMRERYHKLFQLLRRVVNEQECLKYMPKQMKS
ncbi:hypothetical protein CV093_01035 [Oceanobacillus sp. 143]|uniref:Uncharacterized protein n=1 Tax=Oceanobacillus zhaokaii TaxID=2052660 RepID=A0A345PCD3_9BACI|nr:hypothetical protein [Oceanobacillus zhaokaii]AXI07663.1 hypothetical protein CUC15_01015 [Oceanobacillus zhaokaii]QGS67843.1 hypothetical protein CV093_01035 [Oceanobacillus sp. 143]